MLYESLRGFFRPRWRDLLELDTKYAFCANPISWICFWFLFSSSKQVKPVEEGSIFGFLCTLHQKITFRRSTLQYLIFGIFHLRVSRRHIYLFGRAQLLKYLHQGWNFSDMCLHAHTPTHTHHKVRITKPNTPAGSFHHLLHQGVMTSLHLPLIYLPCLICLRLLCLNHADCVLKCMNPWSEALLLCAASCSTLKEACWDSVDLQSAKPLGLMRDDLTDCVHRTWRMAHTVSSRASLSAPKTRLCMIVSALLSYTHQSLLQDKLWFWVRGSGASGGEALRCTDGWLAVGVWRYKEKGQMTYWEPKLTPLGLGAQHIPSSASFVPPFPHLYLSVTLSVCLSSTLIIPESRRRKETVVSVC